jgi:hypothetical protein
MVFSWRCPETGAARDLSVREENKRDDEPDRRRRTACRREAAGEQASQGRDSGQRAGRPGRHRASRVQRQADPLPCTPWLVSVVARARDPGPAHEHEPVAGHHCSPAGSEPELVAERVHHPDPWRLSACGSGRCRPIPLRLPQVRQGPTRSSAWPVNRRVVRRGPCGGGGGTGRTVTCRVRNCRTDC